MADHAPAVALAGEGVGRHELALGQEFADRGQGIPWWTFPEGGGGGGGGGRDFRPEILRGGGFEETPQKKNHPPAENDYVHPKARFPAVPSAARSRGAARRGPQLPQG